MKWLYDTHQRNGFKIHSAGSMSGGVTQFSDFPHWVKVGSRPIIINAALQHEIGHALMPLFQHHLEETKAAFRSDLRKEGSAHRNNPQLHPYDQYIQADDDRCP